MDLSTNRKNRVLRVRDLNLRRFGLYDHGGARGVHAGNSRLADSPRVLSGNRSRNYHCARYIKRKGYIVYPSGHPALNTAKTVPVFEVTPESKVIRLEQ